MLNRFWHKWQKPAAVMTLTTRVLLVIHNPFVRSYGVKLQELFQWHNPYDLAQQYITDVYDASYGIVNYEIAAQIEVDGFPVKEDGFLYETEMYVERWRTNTGFHMPDWADYGRLLTDLQIIPKINLGQIDEVWLFGFPYAGYYESRMVGPDAFWCNAPPLINSSARRRFVVMGFNYERGVGEMLENLGHRVESIMRQVFRYQRGAANLWERFTRYDLTHPGLAECGNVHFAPNSTRDYEWGNPREVLSGCDNWLNFPKLDNPPRLVSCRDWGNGDIREHHLWWLRRLPHIAGKEHGILNNWWLYITDPNLIAI